MTHPDFQPSTTYPGLQVWLEKHITHHLLDGRLIVLQLHGGTVNAYLRIEGRFEQIADRISGGVQDEELVAWVVKSLRSRAQTRAKAIARLTDELAIATRQHQAYRYALDVLDPDPQIADILVPVVEAMLTLVKQPEDTSCQNS